MTLIQLQNCNGYLPVQVLNGPAVDIFQNFSEFDRKTKDQYPFPLVNKFILIETSFDLLSEVKTSEFY